MYGLWVIFIIIIISSIPAIAVFVWFRLAKYQFSISGFLFALLAGAAAIFPALLLQRFLDLPVQEGSRLELFYYFFIRIAATEELSRLLMLLVFFRISSLISQSGSEKFSGLVSYATVKKASALGLVAGLGFALMETSALIIKDMAMNIEFGLFLILRIIAASLLHAACGSRIGAAAVIFHSNIILAILRILIAITIHGIYNFMISMPFLQSTLGILIALSAFVSSILAIRGGWETQKSIK